MTLRSSEMGFLLLAIAVDRFMCLVNSSPVRKRWSDTVDSFAHVPLTPLNMSPLLLPASTSKQSPQQTTVTTASDQRRASSSTWDTPHSVQLVRKPGDSLGISIVGGRFACSTDDEFFTQQTVLCSRFNRPAHCRFCLSVCIMSLHLIWPCNPKTV